MSHELRTPMNHIIGFSELMIEKHFGELTAEQEEYLGDILHSGKHLLSLINDILDLSKVEAGKTELEPAECSICDILENSIIMVKEKSLKHRIQVSTDIQGISKKIIADERKIKQILYNLLANAVKFTPPGGRVSLTASQGNGHGNGSGQNDEIHVSVIDSGIGIASNDLERIFSPFEQAEASSTRKFQGTGLGLSLTKEYVALHGGRIWAESAGEGHGSRFHFTIPTTMSLEKPV